MSSESYLKLYNKQSSRSQYYVYLRNIAIFILILVSILALRYYLTKKDAYGTSTKEESIDPDVAQKGRILVPDDDEPVRDRAVAPDKSCCNVYDMTQAIQEEYQCTELDFEVSPKVCFYPEEHLSSEVNSEWVDVSLLKIRDLLDEGKGEYGFIDVGAKLGIYSLVAAAGGSQVLAVEPDINNIKRFHEAVKLGGFEKQVTLLHNAISDAREYVNIGIDQEPVREILMSDLAQFCKFKSAIMKLDIAGYERQAFRHAKYLFKEIRVSHVFVEWDHFNTIDDVDKLFVNDMVSYMSKRGYVPRGLTGRVLSAAKWNLWPNNIYWHRM